MPERQQSVAGLLFFVLMLWMIYPDAENRTQSLILSDLASERLTRSWEALDVLNETKWGDFRPSGTQDGEEDIDQPSWLNLTGFREVDNFAWGDLDRFREKGAQLHQYAIPTIDKDQSWEAGDRLPVWTNASGTVHGEWVRWPASSPRGHDSYNLSNSVPEMHWIGDKVDWARNMTGDSGSMTVILEGNRTVTEYDQLATEGGALGGGAIRNVKATVQIEDTEGTHQNWEMRLWGAHWPRRGVILMTTTSEKFEGIFGLPHLTPSEDYFQSSQMLLNHTLPRTLKDKEMNRYIDQNAPWSSDIENPTYTAHPYPHCEFILYAQVLPPAWQDVGLVAPKPEKNAIANIIEAMESELEMPEGAPVGRIPRLQMSAVIYSPDCGFFLETKGPPGFPPGEAQHLTGVKHEVHLHIVKSWLLGFAVVIFLQVILLKGQVLESRTPSTMARVSFPTISVMVISDGMAFISAMTWISSAASTFLPTMVLIFSSFLSVFIGICLLNKIHEVQVPESTERRDRNQQGGTTGSGNSTTTAPSPAPEGIQQQSTSTSGPLLPAPVTMGRPSAPPISEPIIIPSDQDIDAEIADAASAVPLNGNAIQRPQPTQSQRFQSLIGRYILLALALGFLIVSSTTWYPHWRSLFLNIIAFIYFSLWIPQIYRNTMRNCRRALRWDFVVGQSALRLLPLAYFWLKEDNFLYATPEPRAFTVICAWVWVQIVVLVGQDVLGPRFGVPIEWTPDAWDYHPVLREDSLEAGGLPIGLVGEPPNVRTSSEEETTSTAQGTSSTSTKRHASGDSYTHTIDCAICHECLEVPVVRSGEEAASVTGAFARRMYMVTPCRHIFHTACLEGWMRFRLQCPICREELPPL